MSPLFKIVSIIKKNSTTRAIINNIFNFSIFQITNYLVPLITIPYIVRIIGVQKFGIISLAMAIIQYFIIIVDYGFDISGTQKIAQNRDDPPKLSLIFNSILTIKIIIALVCFALLILLSKYVKSIGLNFDLYLYAFLSIPAQILLSLWFFTAIEKTIYLNYINFISRTIYLLGIFIIINNQSDYIYVPLVNSFSLLISGFFSIFLIYKNFHLSVNVPSLADIKFFLRDGWQIFLANLFITLYRNSNIVILGFFVSNQMVGIYSAGEKLIKILQSVFIPINRVMYPFISRQKLFDPKKSEVYVKYMLVFMGSIALIFSVLLIIFAKPITLTIFGKQFEMTIEVLQIAGLSLFFGMVNYVVGIIYMLNYNMKAEFFKSVSITGILNVVLCTLFVIKWQALGAAISFVGAEFVLTSLFIFYITSNKMKQKKLTII